MPGKNVRSRKQVCMVGPGLDAALSRLGSPGQSLREHWSAMSEPDLLAEEGAAVRLRLEQATTYDERRSGTRWRAYGRVGLVCAILRMAGRQVREDRSDCRVAG